MSIAEIILSCVTALLGGTNIIQIFSYRSLKKKSEAEAEQEEIKSLKMIIDMQNEQIQLQQARYEQLQAEYDALHVRCEKLEESVNQMRVFFYDNSKK